MAAHSSIASANGLAQDARALDGLRTKAAKDPKAALETAAKQFEAVFMNMVMKSMRDTLPKDGAFGGSEMQMYQGMLDQQMAQGIASGKGVGLSDMIVKQLSRNLQVQQTPSSRAETLRKAVADVCASAPETVDEPCATVNAAARKSAGQVTRAANAAGASATVASATASAPKDFVERLWAEAKTAEARIGVPAEFMLGQAALESGWGKREILAADGTTSYNLFGIKATGGWAGKTVDAVTTEYVNGRAIRKVERFRAYDSYADAFADYAQLIGTKPRYAAALQQSSASGFASSLQRAGYATDPAYAEKLTRVINQTLSLSRTV